MPTRTCKAAKSLCNKWRTVLISWKNRSGKGVIACVTIGAQLVVTVSGAAAGMENQISQSAIAPVTDVATSVTTQPIVAVVTLRSPTTVTGSDILLGQIADIVTPDAELRSRLAALPVGKAALAGGERTLFVGSIQVRLRQAGIPDSAVRLVAQTDTIVVRTAAAMVRVTELQKVAEKAIVEALTARVRAPLPPSVTVTCPTLTQDIPVTNGAAYDIRLTGGVSFAPLSDQATVPMAVWSDGKLQQQITARCSVNAEAEVAVLARKMDRYEALSIADIRWERRNLAARPMGVITRSAAGPMENWRMIYPQEAGVELTWDMIQAQPHALADSEVELVAVVGTIQIVDLGRLLKDARIGEQVAVKNSRTGTVVYGTLVTPKRVVVQAM